jgi:hypothetical protein
MPRPALLALALALAGCGTAGWKPPPVDPLDGFQRLPTKEGQVRELVRGTSVVQIHPPFVEFDAVTLAGWLGDPAMVEEHRYEITGTEEATEIELGPVELFDRVRWVDVRFTMTTVRRRSRLAWFDETGGLRVYRLTAPVRTWTAREASAFHTFVREELERLRPAPPEE